MTYTVTVVYQTGNDIIKTNELVGVEKVERAYEKMNGETFETLRVYTRGHTWFTWMASGVLNINMIPERD